MSRLRWPVPRTVAPAVPDSRIIRPPAPVTGPQNIPVGQVTETGTVLTVGRAKAKAIGQVTETGTVLPIGRSKSRTIGLVTETATVRALVRSKARTLGVVTGVEVALPVSMPGEINQPVGLVTETSVAMPVGRAKAKTIGQVSEVGQALSVVTSDPPSPARTRSQTGVGL